MTELLEKITIKLLEQGNSALVTFMILVIAYLVWREIRKEKSFKEDSNKLIELNQKLQQDLQQLMLEDKKSLIDIINKYNDGFNNVKETLTQIKAVMDTLIRGK